MKYNPTGIRKIRPIPFSGDVYFHAVDSIGKRGYITTAGKFNFKGTPIYFGMLNEQDLVKAASLHAGKHGVSLLGYAEPRRPYVMEVSLQTVADLRDENNIKKLGLKVDDILGSDRSKTQKVGKRAIAIRVQGILFPSYAGDCLVIFKDVIDLLKEPEKAIKIRPINHYNFRDYIKRFLS